MFELRSRALAALTALLGGLASLSAQEAELARLLSDYRRASSTTKKIEVLDAIAALAGRQDAEALTKALAVGLVDDSVDVRLHAIPLVGRAPDRSQAMRALTDGSREYAKRWSELVESARLEPVDLPDMFEDPKGFKKAIDAAAKAAEAAKAGLERCMAEAPVLAAYVDTLTSFDDDGVLPAYEALIVVAGSGEQGQRIARAAAARAGGMAVAVKQVRLLEKKAKEQTDRLAKRERERPRRVPKRWRGTKDKWKQQEQRRIQKLVEAARKNATSAQTELNGYLGFMRELAAELGAVKPPTGGRATSWEAWARRVDKARASDG